MLPATERIYVHLHYGEFGLSVKTVGTTVLQPGLLLGSSIDGSCLSQKTSFNFHFQKEYF